MAVKAGASKEVGDSIKKNSIPFFRLLRKVETLLQLKDHFPDFVPYQLYLRAVRDFWRDKTEINLRADNTLKDLYKLGVAGQNRVFKLHLWAQEESFNLKRKLTDVEVATQAQRFGLRQQEFQAYQRVEGDFEYVLAELKAAMIQEATNQYGPLAPVIIKQINQEFTDLANRNYFPTSRFGRHGVVVKATAPMTWNGESFKKGQVIYFSTEEGYLGGELGAEKYQRKMAEELEAKFAGQPVEVTARYLLDNERAFFSLPPSMIDLLSDKLNLTPHQITELKQLAAKLAPGRGFVKHHIKKRSIAGFSGEGKRAYADYMQHVATHLARLKNRLQLEQAIEQITKGPGWTGTQLDRDYLVQTVRDHHQYLIDPGNEHALMRSIVFPWFFAFSYKQVIMNLTQIPIFWGPMMAKRLQEAGIPPVKADAITTISILKQLKNVGSIFSTDKSINILRWGWDIKSPKIDSDIARMWQVGMSEGWLDESFATEAAAATQAQSVLSKLPHFAALNLDYRIRRLIEASTRHFKLSEDVNRFSTSASTYELARTHLGLSHEDAIAYTRDTIAATMGEYARWARPEAMRGGWKPAVFTFKMFLQMALHYIGSNKGGIRFWLALLVMAGWKGVPLANELLNMTDLAGTKIKELSGWKNPRVDAEKELMELTEMIGLNPDLAANGLARYGFGLSFLPGMPNVDYASSIQLGRIVPGAEAITKTTLGAMKPKEAVLQTLGEIFGVGTATGLGATVSILDPRESGPVSAAVPRFARDVMRVKQFLLRRELANKTKERVIDVDAADPYDMADIIGKSVMYGLFGPPTEMRAETESNIHANMIIAYYLTRRENILTRWSLALANGDAQEKASARKEFLEFQRTAPPEFRMRASDLRESMVQRIENERLEAMGMPTQERYFKMIQSVKKLRKPVGAQDPVGIKPPSPSSVPPLPLP